MLEAELALTFMQTRSPHLFGASTRTWPGDSAAVKIIALTFQWVIAEDGEVEIDFKRDPTVSFNPRPARIALILLNDVELKSPIAIAAGILATASNPLGLVEKQQKTLLPAASSFLDARSFFDTIAYTQLEMWKLSKLPDSSEVISAIQIRCALFLDRTRHLHRMTSANRLDTWIECYSTRHDYLALAEKYCPKLYLLLATWERRFRKRLIEQQVLTQGNA